MNGAIWVLLLSGILGFRVGMLGFPDWQVAVETAQVLAGVVTYPPDNIFYIYHTRLWTALHQVLAVALGAGVTEMTLSLLVSGVQGMLMFQALALFVYALSRDVLLGVGAAALIFFTRSAEYGTVYPLFLLGTEHTYGVIGLANGVLVMAVLGAGWYRTGAFLLGVAPCIHPSLGSWTGAVVALAVLSDVRRLRLALRPALPWFAAGCAVTLVSLFIQFSIAPVTPPEMVRLSPDDFSTFIKLWDGHRAAVNIWHNGAMLNVASVIVAVVWITARLKPDTTAEFHPSSKFLLRITAASSLLALAMIPISWIPPERLPAPLLVLMPGRYLNFAALTFVAMLIGLLASRRALWSRLVLLFLTCGLLVGDHSMLWEFLEHHHHFVYQSSVRPLWIVWIATAVLLADAARAHLTHPSRPTHPLHPLHPLHLSHLVLLALVVLMTLHQHAERSGAHFNDRTNDVFFADIASHRGVLLVAGDLHLIQLRTRRPILLDTGALDTVMYSLQTGAAMQRMLREIYGLDLLKPPADAIGAGRIPALSHQKTWESFTPDRWRAIRRDFGVTQVLAYADWALQLPVSSQSRRLLLYDIPDR
ncbi:MAG TPA: hypothetical protein VM115_09660 [Vicinamibacterales bacterium]|nr:hypothetical protein [Vicinamibacterales bacterium]